MPHSDRDYNSDVDDVALRYVTMVRKGGGSVEIAVRLHRELVNLLIRVLDEGWTTSEELAAMRYLASLQTPLLR